MNGHKAIAARLAGYAGLTALVGTRVSVDQLPAPAAYPAVVYKRSSGDGEHGSTADPGLAQARFTVLAFDKTRLGALLVAAQVKAALNRWRQTTSAGVTVDDCFCELEVDLYDDATGVYYVSADYRLHYRE